MREGGSNSKTTMLGTGSTLFGSGQTAAAPPAGPSTTAASTSAPAVASNPGSFSFNPSSVSAAQPTFGATPSSSFSFSLATGAPTAPTTTPAAATGLATPIPAALPVITTADSGAAFSFTPQATSTTTAPTSKPSFIFSTAGAATTSAPGIPSVSTGLAPPASTTSSGFALGSGVAPTTTGSFLSTAPRTAVAAAAAATTTTAVVAPTISAVAVPGGESQMNFRQLEEQINKWMLELEEQEKAFLQQATQVNAWDKLLLNNGDKIHQLNHDLDRVKVDQQRLDNELDFIHSQQKELEDLLTPLEASVEQLPPLSYQHHADIEREHTYQLAESIDGQLKRMVLDLKEIIDHLNTTNTSEENTDPVHQITKILNAHMDSLRWIDQNAGLLNRRVEDISKQMELQRKEQERNYRLVFN
ncbi:Hypothetical predicted protein [Octopus vulgaris]|uniref:Nucleoporin NSP1-like C-terminal domain-containing protein n=2 Tax=Octopus vulgaris TaxID=6645 RepID=A0AA36FNN4_OCTVU|nr:Hypothetical predicted protein [Octopus vulgaris]